MAPTKEPGGSPSTGSSPPNTDVPSMSPSASPSEIPSAVPSILPTKSPATKSINPTARPSTLSPVESTLTPTGDTGPACGCILCTDEVLNAEIDGFTCRERIDFVISDNNFTETAACSFVASQFPDPCGPCHPTCIAPTPEPTVVPTRVTTAIPTEPEGPTCGCNECTEEVLNTFAAGISCGDRIAFLQTLDGGELSEEVACTFIGTEFPQECGPCNPQVCDGRVTSNPTQSPSTASPTNSPTEIPTTLSPTNPPTSNPTNSPTGSPTASPTTEAPTLSPTGQPTVNDGGEPAGTCGCADCTEEVLNLDAAGLTCGARIQFAQTSDGGDFSEQEACFLVSTEYPNICGPCNPNTCNDGDGPSTEIQCGCEACTQEILERDAEGLSCQTRIDFFQTPDGGGVTEIEACSLVASGYPEICGSCSPCR